MKKPGIILALLIMLSFFAGCIIVDPFVQAGERNASPDQATALQVCRLSCENNIRFLPLGCICPETPTPVPANVTPASSGT